ncbi:MAG: NAD(P)/FAD-dependent oxidoreductase [Akkermansiaceae bacterium]|jgi:hypothetical protein|nr:NAD(P)/FAD-dependent oxidoreductase [Akkermansiaceae bacterium]
MSARTVLEQVWDVAVVGGGPAGLRVAELTSAAGLATVLFEGKPSVGRKLLVAGKGGLNLTHGGDLAEFAARYAGPGQPDGFWAGLLAEFAPADLRTWAAGLGVETFEATSGRIYPRSMKAAPLLRGWVRRLRDNGAQLRMGHRWIGIEPGTPHRLHFANGTTAVARTVVLALGGASWPQTGSDGEWPPVLSGLGIRCRPLAPANCGWEHPWPEAVLAAAEGQPIKNITASAGPATARGELLVTRYGLEGGIIYQLGPALRDMPAPALAIDFKPAHSAAQLAAKLSSVRRDFLAAARSAWRLGAAAHAILACHRWDSAAALAGQAKHCVLPLTGPRPIAEAISSAGGVCWEELDATLMVRKFPGLYVAGEMVDWEAPTGGYLLHGCLATATRVARAVVRAAGATARR